MFLLSFLSTGCMRIRNGLGRKKERASRPHTIRVCVTVEKKEKETCAKTEMWACLNTRSSSFSRWQWFANNLKADRVFKLIFWTHTSYQIKKWWNEKKWYWNISQLSKLAAFAKNVDFLLEFRHNFFKTRPFLIKRTLLEPPLNSLSVYMLFIILSKW